MSWTLRGSIWVLGPKQWTGTWRWGWDIGRPAGQGLLCYCIPSAFPSIRVLRCMGLYSLVSNKNAYGIPQRIEAPVPSSLKRRQVTAFLFWILPNSPTSTDDETWISLFFTFKKQIRDASILQSAIEHCFTLKTKYHGQASKNANSTCAQVLSLMAAPDLIPRPRTSSRWVIFCETLTWMFTDNSTGVSFR